jgi:rhamnogalacturonan endolyase
VKQGVNRRWKKAGLTLLGAIQIAALLPLSAAFAADTPGAASRLQPPRQMEYLDRGLVAVKVEGGVFVSWRLLGTEPSDIGFNLYRDGVKVNAAPITDSTNFLDPHGTPDSKYTVRAVVNGREQRDSGESGVWGANYLTLPLDKPADGTTPDGAAYTYSANDASAADLDGDGQYEIILKWDPSNSKDNSQNGYTGNVYLDAYKLDGTRMWRIDLGRNIRAGAHYSPFMVYDLDGDGKAEVAVKTADGTVDGAGKVIGDPNADYRNSSGRILDGPEYLTIFNGQTGQEMVTADYDPPRGKVTDWGDNYGNRVDRFLACIAYLDGQRPSLVMARGYYTRTVLVAYNWRDGKLTKQWRFDSNNPGYESWVAQGNHNLSVADVDGDGKDEIIYGAITIDDNGQGLYNTTLGHGDALHVGDLDPTHPGLEVFKVMEHKDSPYGAALWDAATGKVLWGAYTGKDTGRGMSADIDPRYPGEEQWASTGVGLYTNKGQKLSSTIPSVNFGIWWDGDLLRELLDNNHIDKWDYNNFKMVNLLTADGAASNNGTKATPSLQADLFGDWREEVVWRTSDSTALRIYTTTDLTSHRIYTLMHDPVYRLGIAWQNAGYNQPPHTGFYLGDGMQNPPVPNIYLTVPAKVDVQPATLNLKSNGGDRSLTVRISLPDGYDASQIDPSSVRLKVNGTEIAAQAPAEGRANGDPVKFDRQQVIAALDGRNGPIQVSVSGTLNDGTHFAGEGTFQAIH